MEFFLFGVLLRVVWRGQGVNWQTLLGDAWVNKSTKNTTYLTVSYHVQYLLSTVSFLPELLLVEKEARHFKRNGQPVSGWMSG